MPGPRTATVEESANLRKPMGLQAYVLIDTPPAIFKARINHDFDGKWNSIHETPYDTVTLGSYGVIQPDMTVLIGTSEGAFDVGVARIRKAASSSKLFIGETSEIKFVDDQYLTVVAGFEPWAKHLRVTSTGVVYIDYDVSYSNQHNTPDPTPALGADVVTWLADEETVDVDFDASGSFCVSGAVITAYAWTCTGADITDANTATPTMTFDTPGRYVAYCEVSTASKSFTGVLIIHIIGTGYNPLYQATIEGLNGDPQTGGYSFDLNIYDASLPQSVLRDRAKVIIFSKDYIDKERIEQGPEVGLENYLASGWIAGETIRYGTQHEMRCEVHGPQYFIGQENAFPVGLEDTAFANNGGGAPDKWTEMQNLTTDKALWHFLHWRSTLTRICNIQLTGDTRKAAQIVAPYSSLWAQLQAISWNVILARACFDRYGRLWVEIEPQLRNTASRATIPVVQDMTEGDYLDGPAITRRILSEASRVEISGVKYSAGTSTALGGMSPGDVQARFGEREVVEFLALTSQAQVIELAGLYAGWKNNPVEGVQIDFPGVNRFLDICPAQYVYLDLDTDATQRGMEFSANHIPRRIRGQPDPKSGKFITSLTLEPESPEWPAIKMDFPGSEDGPPIDDDTNDPPIDDDPPDDPSGSDTDVVCATRDDVRTTEDFDEAAPTWTSKFGAIDGEIQDFSRKTDDIAYAVTGHDIWKTSDLTAASPTWESVYDATTDWDTDKGAVPEFIRVVASANWVYVLGYSDQTGGVAAAYLFRSGNGGETWTELLIQTIEDSYSGFTMDSYVFSFPQVHDETGPYRWYPNIPRNDGISDYNPWAMGYKLYNPTLGSPPSDMGPMFEWRNSAAWEPAYPGADTFMNAFYDAGPHKGPWPPSFFFNTALAVEQKDALAIYLTSKFGTEESGWHRQGTASMPKETGRTNIGLNLTHLWSDPPESNTFSVGVWVVWAAAALNAPRAIDVGKHNDDVVYVGLKDTIVVSRDAGNTWNNYIEDHGANDIHVPAYDNDSDLNILYWSTDAHLYWTKGVSGGLADKGSSLLNETVARIIPYRIASDPDEGWPVFALADLATTGWNLYELGKTPGIVVSQDLVVSGIIEARALRVYKSSGGRRIFYLDANDINYSGDDGATWTLKKGSWTEYAYPIKVEALTA